MSAALQTALTLLGLGCLVVGAFTLAAALGWTVAGSALLLLNWGMVTTTREASR